MVVSCAAYNCVNRQKKCGDSENGLTFHRVPVTKPLLLKKWIAAIRREDWEPTKYSYICSNHFTEDSYKEGNTVRRRLKLDAVPSIFDFHKRLKSVKKRRRIQCNVEPKKNQRIHEEPKRPVITYLIPETLGQTRKNGNSISEVQLETEPIFGAVNRIDNS